MSALDAALDGRPVIRALVLTPERYTFGRGTLVGDLIAAAGGVNVAAQAGYDDIRQMDEAAIRGLDGGGSRGAARVFRRADRAAALPPHAAGRSGGGHARAGAGPASGAGVGSLPLGIAVCRYLQRPARPICPLVPKYQQNPPKPFESSSVGVDR